MSNKAKRDSPLVQSVLALDDFLRELERIGTKINATDMSADFDLDYIQKLMTRFTECGQGVTQEVSNLSKQLQEAQARAETVAQGVARQAGLFNIRRNEHIAKMDEFRALGEKVRDLNTAIAHLRDDRENMASNLPALEAQLAALIEELETLQKSARASKIKALEKNAHSLIQTLQNVQKKLQAISRR
jgi:predicted RNase H-like nuclease (RuvC/YqgF family)